MEKVAIGSYLDGRYEIQEHVGRGRLGEVFRARDAESGERRLVKVLSPELAQDQSAVDRFHKDLRKAVSIRHPRVAALHDYSLLPDGSLYLAWELIEGEDLESRFEREGAFGMTDALNLTLQICDGLSAIHREGLAHRDLTPSNLILEPSHPPQIKVIDLGLSRSLRGPAQGNTQSIDGMLHYCSPEHVGLFPGTTPDALSDQFALAVIAYQLISGRLPFKGISTAGSLEARYQKPPRALVARDVGVKVAPRLATALQRAMSCERSERFTELTELARELRAVLDGLAPVDALPGVATAAPIETVVKRPAPAPSRSEDVTAAVTVPAAVPATGSTRAPEAESLPEADAEPDLPDGAALAAAIEASIACAEFAEALERIEEIRASGAMTPDLASLELRARMALRHQRHTQAMEARQMLEAYLAQRQEKLAALALEALLEVDPDAEDRGLLLERVESLTRQVERDREIDELLNRGFERLQGGDQDGALAALLDVESKDPAAAARLRQSIERHRIEVSQEERIEKLKRRAEELLSRRRLGEVEGVLDSLAALGVPQLVTDVYRHRIESLRAERAVDATADEIEARFRKELAHRQWAEARQLANDLEQLLGDPQRPARMRDDVAHAEADWRREESVREGVEQLKSYLALGHVQEAEVAFAIVRKLDPEHPQNPEFERQIQILRKSAHG